MLYMETSFPALLTVLLLIALKKQILDKIKATFFKKIPRQLCTRHISRQIPESKRNQKMDYMTSDSL